MSAPGDSRSRLKEWLATGEARLHPLTFPQRELWEATAVPVGDPANHICCLIRIDGALKKDFSEIAIRMVTERQEALGISFLPGKEKPLQLVRKSPDRDLKYRELTPDEATPENIEKIAQEIFRLPFDMVRGPLFRVEMLRVSEKEHIVVFAIHHAIADGWSLGVFVEDLFGAYITHMQGTGEVTPLPPVPQSYTAWDAAERAFWTPAELEKRAGFWRTALAGAKPLWPYKPLPLETSPLPPLRRQVVYLPGEFDTIVRDLARRGEATKFSVLLTAFQITLARWLEVEDITVGSPIANRNRQITRETMGYFAGNVPLRAQVDLARPFVESLRATHQITLDSFVNAMPFAELAKAVPHDTPAGCSPIYQARFALQNHPVPDMEMPNLSAKLRMRSTGTARFDLGCEITEMEDSLEVAWLSRQDMFSPADIEGLDREFQATLRAAHATPLNPVAR